MADTYYEPDLVKKTLNEDGLTANETKIKEYGEYVSRIMDGEFIFILGDTTPFPSVPDWFKKFTNSLLRAKFWLDEDNNDVLWKQIRADIKEYRTKRFEQPRAQTRSV